MGDARAASERITSLDVVRGVAVLGILPMNVVSFGLAAPAYFNLDAGGSDTPLDRAVGIAGELFADQKFMAIFSMLFGAGIVLFHERAVAKGRRAVWLSLWRNTILLGMGIAHSWVWEGDVLLVYALCAPILIAARRLSDRALVASALALVSLSPIMAIVAQSSVGSDGAGLGDVWGVPGDTSDAVDLWLVTDYSVRALGLMFIGVVAYRRGFLSGRSDRAVYRRWAIGGCGFGLTAAAAGVIWVATTEPDTDVAVLATIPNTIGTIPFALGIVSVIVLSLDRMGGAADRLAAVGRMALTNYLSQTAICLTLFELVLDVDLGRTGLLGVVLGVWALQLVWSPWWLHRFRYGPLEWCWRAATYRSLPAFRV